MSDNLDADLYGDLYGNDETDFADQVQDEKEESSAVEPTPTEPSSTVNHTEATTLVIPKAEPAHIDVNTQSFSNSAIGQSPSTYNPPITQQIPTYEQPQPAEYREPPPQRHDGGYSSIPVPERTVRPSEMKDEGKMFIGGLNWDTTDESLRNYFTQFGKVDACTIMRDAAGRSRCFAFLTFEEPASVNAVMVREHFLDGKIIDPKRAIPRQEHQRATKLFIGGLAGSVTSESMREFFSQFGKVIDSTVMLDRETGRSKGFGFVSFEDTNVQPFLGFGNLEIDGKVIDVKLAQPRYQRDSYPNEREDSAEFSRGPGGFPGQQGFGAATTPAAAPSGNTPFDPQALAALYTRMFQMTGAGQLNPMMGAAMGGGMGVNPMLAGMSAGPGSFGGGMRPGMGMGVGGAGMGMGMGGAPGMGGMGRGVATGMMQGGGGGGMNPNIPRGPRGGPGGPGGMGGAGVGPQRAGQRGQHNYHPYAR